jgi:simple sugar transport system ATP-binding protein
VAGRIAPLRGKLQVAQPVGFIPEDRVSEGLIPGFTLTENVVLGSGGEGHWIRGRRIVWHEAQARTAELIADYEIKATGPEAKAETLSGGNQQKLVLARELSRRPAVIVAENPTRGLDIGATAAIHARLRSAAAAGAAVLFHSSDLDEVLQLADRIIVVTQGVISEAPTGASRAEIGALMLRSGRDQ